MSIAVSIIIPTCKRSALLIRCLAALLRQDFDPERLEIVVVVDGPDPATVNIVRHLVPLSPRTLTLCLQENRGPAAARNAGWQIASGELILFTDDDCLPTPHWISAYWEAYKSYRPAFPARDGLAEHLAFRGPVHVPCPPRPTDYEKNTACLESAAFVTANCACTPAALRRIGGFDEAFTMAWREDSDLEFKLIEAGIPIVTVPRARLTHPVRSAPWGISLKEQKKSLFNALLYKKHPDLFRRYIYRRPFWNYYVMILLVLIAVVAALTGHPFVSGIAAGAWALLTLAFTRRRLYGTSHSPSHITEMLLTSACIPFLSVYWTIYGAIRFKTFFL